MSPPGLLYERARLQYQHRGHVLGEAGCTRNLGDIARERSDYNTARSLYEQARQLYQRISDVLGEANCIRSLGNIA